MKKNTTLDSINASHSAMLRHALDLLSAWTVYAEKLERHADVECVQNDEDYLNELNSAIHKGQLLLKCCESKGPVFGFLEGGDQEIRKLLRRLESRRAAWDRLIEEMKEQHRFDLLRRATNN